MTVRDELLWYAYLSDDGNIQAARRVIFANRPWCKRLAVTRGRLLVQAENLFLDAQVPR